MLKNFAHINANMVLGQVLTVDFYLRSLNIGNITGCETLLDLRL